MRRESGPAADAPPASRDGNAVVVSDWGVCGRRRPPACTALARGSAGRRARARGGGRRRRHGVVRAAARRGRARTLTQCVSIDESGRRAPTRPTGWSIRLTQCHVASSTPPGTVAKRHGQRRARGAERRRREREGAVAHHSRLESVRIGIARRGSPRGPEQLGAQITLPRSSHRRTGRAGDYGEQVRREVSGLPHQQPAHQGRAAGADRGRREGDVQAHPAAERERVARGPAVDAQRDRVAAPARGDQEASAEPKDGEARRKNHEEPIDGPPPPVTSDRREVESDFPTEEELERRRRPRGHVHRCRLQPAACLLTRA